MLGVQILIVNQFTNIVYYIGKNGSVFHFLTPQVGWKDPGCPPEVGWKTLGGAYHCSEELIWFSPPRDVLRAKPDGHSKGKKTK